MSLNMSNFNTNWIFEVPVQSSNVLSISKFEFELECILRFFENCAKGTILQVEYLAIDERNNLRSDAEFSFIPKRKRFFDAHWNFRNGKEPYISLNFLQQTITETIFPITSWTLHLNVRLICRTYPSSYFLLIWP